MLPAESPEIHALLAKLQDVATAAGGCLEPNWDGAPAYGQISAAGAGSSEGQNGAAASSGWSRRDARRGGREAADGGEDGQRQRCVLEDFTPCSKSHLWKLMMSFYDRKGVESWSQVGLVHQC